MAALMKWLISFFKRNRDTNNEDEGLSENATIEYDVQSVNVIHIVPNETGAICQDVDDTFIIPEGGVTHLVVLESPQLTRLVLPGNQVNDLTHLIILQCKLREIPASIKELNNLIVLDITGNKIRELPDAISSLNHLRELYIMSNDFRILPKCILSLTELERLEVANNPRLMWPPIMVCLQGLDSIREFMMNSLELQSGRRDTLTGSKAYCNSLFREHGKVPTLHHIVLEFLLSQPEVSGLLDEATILPHLLKKQINYANELGKPMVQLSKCSRCGMYCTSEASFNTHICRR